MSQPLPPTGDDPDLPPSAPGHLHLSLPRRARLAAAVFFLIAASMAPWTVFLGFTLPPKYDAGHWDLLWTGFDVGLICVLGYAAWAAWFQRQIVATTAIVAGTLLVCDAWFDIITSIGHGDHWVTLLTGFGGELPLAVFFFWLYRRIVLASLAAVYQQAEGMPAPRRLRDAQVLFLNPRLEVPRRAVTPAGPGAPIRGSRPGDGRQTP